MAGLPKEKLNKPVLDNGANLMTFAEYPIINCLQMLWYWGLL